jgi:starch-binding outer membrane protein, SusD/RagB family
MKKYIISCLGLCLFTLGCQPELNLAPISNKSTATFYKTEADASTALTAAYSVLQTSIYIAETILTPTTVASDDGVPFLTGNADRRALWTYNISTNNTWTSAPWASSYSGIQRANVVINNVPQIKMNTSLRDRYVAEAKFLRALHYFNLVRFYGGVPLVSEEVTILENAQISRASVEEIYKFIEKDLLEAETVLPNAYPVSEAGHATKGSANGLLSKVYLTWAGTFKGSEYWSKAAAKAKEVIDGGNYDLWQNFDEAFEIKNRGGKESVFEVTYVTDVLGQQHSTYWAPRGAAYVPGNGFGTIRVSKSLWESFSPTDKRISGSFLTNDIRNPAVKLTVENPDPSLALSFWKLTDLTSKVFGGNGKSFPYMRFSEVLLIFAEALNEVSNGPTSEAYKAINRVRTRAGLSDLSGLSQAQFKDAILLERRLELSHEGHRWFDLVRTGRLLEAVSKEVSFGRNPTIKAHHVLFPIPQREIDANSKLVQNAGY